MLSLLFFFNCIGKVVLMSGCNIKFLEIFQKLNLSQMCLIISVGRERGGGGGGGGQRTLWFKHILFQYYHYIYTMKQYK